MGVVYRAHDDGTLDRDVAIKVLPAGALADESARRYFRKEATALSKLNHPNIATVFDFGSEGETDFLVEELIPGSSLDEILMRGPLSEKDIIHLGTQLCEGVAAAHKQGIIHRDLKPANIRLTPDSHLKILDFGLAQVLRSTGTGSDLEVTASLTEPKVSGTLPYMAPEQLLNEKLDARTDIWAIGCVLYEMTTGQRPFPGNGPALTDAILHQQPAAARKLKRSISPSLEAIVLKCLEKDPVLRYASAQDIAVDLRRLSTGTVTKALAARRRSAFLKVTAITLTLVLLGAISFLLYRRSRPAAGEIRSVAVLPFAISNSDPDSEYLADGITDSLITSVSQFREMQVMARSTVFRYKGKTVDPQSVGHELKVSAVLLGWIVARKDTLDVRSELVDVAQGTQLWAGHYNRKPTELMKIQEEIAREIADALRVRLSAGRQRPLSGTSNPEAYQLYLRGRFNYEKWSRSGSKLALDYYNEALAKDPSFAPAYAGIANTYAFAYGYVDVPFREATALAKQAALKALDIDPDLAEAHAALAQVAMREWNLPEAEAQFKKAIELNPNNTDARHQYAHYLLSVRRFEQAEVQAKKALELDPLSPAMRLHLAFHYSYTRNYPKAEILYRALIKDDPDYALAYWQLLRVLYYEGKLDEAFATYLDAKRLSNTAEDEIASLKKVYASHGWPGILRNAIAETLANGDRKSKSAVDLASDYALLGDHEAAIRWLEQAEVNRDPSLLEIDLPEFASIQSDRRIKLIRENLGLPQ